MENQENMIEFIAGQKTATVTFSNRKDDFKYFVENDDGTVCAKIPLKWVRINPGSKTERIMTDEQREAARIRFQNYQKQRKKTKRIQPINCYVKNYCKLIRN